MIALHPFHPSSPSARSRRALLGALLAPALLLATSTVASAAPCPGSGAAECAYTASSVIGSRGEGVLRFPQAVAVDKAGQVYVGDQYTHLVQVYGPDGAFRRQIGGPGTAAGQFGSIGGIAVNDAGEVYVADGRNKIERFDAQGNLIDTWGRGGSDVGQFNFGSGSRNDSGAGGGIAVGADGMVYVADTRNDRIQRFAPDGSQARVIVPPGTVRRPQGLAVAGTRLLVADDLGHRIVVFDTGGRQISTFASGPGDGPGQLQNPYDVAVDGKGRVFVADDLNHRVVRFGSKSQYLYRARWGSFGTGLGDLQYPRALGVAADGTTSVADPGNNRVVQFDVSGTPLRTIGTSGRNPGQWIAPEGVAADAAGYRAVTDSVSGRVQVLAPDNTVVAIWGDPAPGPTILRDPAGVAFDGAGDGYVVDHGRSRVFVFSRATGKLIRTIGTPGTGTGGELSSPSAATIVGDTLYVADTGNRRVARFGLDGTFRGSTGLGSLRTPRGVAVTPAGNRIYVSDASRHRVFVFDTDGTELEQIGARGSKPGRFNSPAQIALDAAGNLWVVDRGNNRVQGLADVTREPLAVFGQRGVDAGQLLHPTGIAVDCNGTVTVADSDNNRVQAFTVPAAARGACAPLSAPVNPPASPLLGATVPQAPQLNVRIVSRRSLLSRRTLPVTVRCDQPCTVNATATLATRAGKRVTVSMAGTPRALPAASTTSLSLRLLPADARRLSKALGKRRGLRATVTVTGSSTNSPQSSVRVVADVTS